MKKVYTIWPVICSVLLIPIITFLFLFAQITHGKTFLPSGFAHGWIEIDRDVSIFIVEAANTADLLELVEFGVESVEVGDGAGSVIHRAIYGDV